MLTGKFKVLITLFLVFAPAIVFGQPNNPPGAPIQGLAILLFAGITFGILRLRKKRNQ